jgi:hypothetical protein
MIAAVWEIKFGYPNLVFYDLQGNARLEVFLEKGFPNIWMYDSNGKQRIQLNTQ